MTTSIIDAIRSWLNQALQNAPPTKLNEIPENNIQRSNEGNHYLNTLSTDDRAASYADIFI